MFGSLALLSGIALFSSAVALPAPPSVTTTPSVTATPQIYQILVGSLQGNTTYTPPYIVSQVPAAQPNPILIPFPSDERNEWGCVGVHLRFQEPYLDRIHV
jgi:hypothetical protein